MAAATAPQEGTKVYSEEDLNAEVERRLQERLKKEMPGRYFIRVPAHGTADLQRLEPIWNLQIHPHMALDKDGSTVWYPGGVIELSRGRGETVNYLEAQFCKNYYEYDVTNRPFVEALEV